MKYIECKIFEKLNCLSFEYDDHKYTLMYCLCLENFIGFVYPDSPYISSEFIKTKIINGKLHRILPTKVVFTK